MNIRSLSRTLRSAEWIPITTVRVLIGIFFCISGGTKLFVPAQFSLMERTLAESHIPFPHFNAVFVSMVEFVCGGSLALGLLTQVCAFVLACVMIVAIATNRISIIHSSGVLAWLDDFLYLPEVLYVMIFFWLIFSGPGRYSIEWLDHAAEELGMIQVAHLNCGIQVCDPSETRATFRDIPHGHRCLA